MIKRLRVAVDHGNRNMKTCNFIFTTGLNVMDKRPGRGEEYLQYEGKYYTLSEQRIPYQRDKTADSRFFILTLFAIMKEMETKPEIIANDIVQVDLPIGLPPKHYADLYEKYEKFFCAGGKVLDVEYCGKPYHICIKDSRAFIQDMAAMLTLGNRILKIPRVVGIDIGGFTTDYLIMRNGQADKGKCESMEKGIITMYNQIISSVNSEYDLLLEECDIDSIIQGKTEYYDESVVHMVKHQVKDFVTDLLSSIRERNIDTKSAYTIFIGGGSVLLKPFLEKSDRLGKYEFIDDLRANAIGYDLLYRAYEGGK